MAMKMASCFNIRAWFLPGVVGLPRPRERSVLMGWRVELVKVEVICLARFCDSLEVVYRVWMSEKSVWRELFRGEGFAFCFDFRDVGKGCCAVCVAASDMVMVVVFFLSRFTCMCRILIAQRIHSGTTPK